MSYENFLSHRIKCDYPGCGKPCDDWWNDQWLTLVKYGVHGRMVSVRHFCTSHLDTMRNPIPAGSYHLPDNTPKDWHTWGEGYMYPIYEPCTPTILNVLEKATPDNPLPNELVEKCALALFRTDTNWAENNPTKREVLDLWEQQMPCIREQFLKRAYAVLHEALILTMPTMKEEPEVSD